VACTILSHPNFPDKTPFDVASELLILADKNAISNLTGERKRTVDAVAQVAL
jgi:hypothetical protein